MSICVMYLLHGSLFLSLSLASFTKKKTKKPQKPKIKKYQIFPEINVIDLNAAMGNGENKELIKQLCRKINCNVGGGVRSIEIAEEL